MAYSFALRNVDLWQCLQTHARGSRARPRRIRDLLAWRPIILDDALIELAWETQDRYRVSFWDALIVAAAKSSACRYLLTEELQADQDFDGVRVVNPFILGTA